MCWHSFNEPKEIIANKDKIVYKLVYSANSEECLSLFRQYHLHLINPYVDIQYYFDDINSFVIKEGYHSYLSVDDFTVSLNTGIFRVAGRTHAIDLNRLTGTLYKAKFIIPADSKYYINKLGEVVSNLIKYTGEYELIY